MDSNSIKAKMINAISRKRKELDAQYNRGIDAAINAVANVQIENSKKEKEA